MTTERADREVLKVSCLEIGELVGRIGYEGCWAKWTTLQPINGERVRDVVPLLHPGDIVASRDERSLGTSRLLCFIVHQTDVRRFALLWQGGEFLVSRIMGKGKNCFLSPTGGGEGGNQTGEGEGGNQTAPTEEQVAAFLRSRKLRDSRSDEQDKPLRRQKDRLRKAVKAQDLSPSMEPNAKKPTFASGQVAACTACSFDGYITECASSHPLALIRCIGFAKGCKAAVHRGYDCSRCYPETLSEKGWTCTACFPDQSIAELLCDVTEGGEQVPPPPQQPVQQPPTATATATATATISASSLQQDDAVAGPVSILMAVVAGTTAQAQTRLLENAHTLESAHVAHRATFWWAVCSFDDNADAWAETRWRSAGTLRLVVNTSTPMMRVRANQRRAKLHHRARLVEAAWQLVRDGGGPAFEYVWFLDEDVSFRAFDAALFLHRWRCAFGAAGPPVIAQPTLSNGTHNGQGWPQRDETYQRCLTGRAASALGGSGDGGGGGACFLRDALALRNDWVEQWATLMDAGFVAWWLWQNTTKQIVHYQLKLNSDFGADEVWCGAAEEWVEALRRDTRGGATAVRPSCAIITVPVVHDDSHTQRQAGQSMHDRYRAGARLLFKAGLFSNRAFVGRGCWYQQCCFGRNCSSHPWWRYVPKPRWELPTSRTALESVRSCAVAGGPTCHNRRLTVRGGGGGGVLGTRKPSEAGPRHRGRRQTMLSPPTANGTPNATVGSAVDEESPAPWTDAITGCGGLTDVWWDTHRDTYDGGA